MKRHAFILVWLLVVLGCLGFVFFNGAYGQQAGDQIYQGDTALVKFKPISINSSSGTTISGVSLFNFAATGVSLASRSPTAGVTVFIDAPVGGENGWIYNTESTTSGNSVYVHFRGSVTVNSNIACTAGVSKYVLVGTTLQKKLVIWSPSANVWMVDAIGTPTVEAD